MKYVMILLSVVAVGCSSNTKKEADAEAPVAQSEEATQEPTSDASAESDLEPVTELEPVASTEGEVDAGGEVDAEGNSTRTFPTVQGETTMSITCEANNDKREVKVTQAKGQTPLCGVAYQKSGTEQTIAIANNQVQYCDTVATQIQTNLQQAGFQCSTAQAAN